MSAARGWAEVVGWTEAVDRRLSELERRLPEIEEPLEAARAIAEADELLVELARYIKGNHVWAGTRLLRCVDAWRVRWGPRPLGEAGDGRSA